MKEISFELWMKIKKSNDLCRWAAIQAIGKTNPKKFKALTGFEPVPPKH